MPSGKMFDDTDEALEELRKLREMDEDDPEIPLINACSANAQAYNAFGSTFLDETHHRLEFATRSHEMRYPNRCPVVPAQEIHAGQRAAGTRLTGGADPEGHHGYGAKIPGL